MTPPRDPDATSEFAPVIPLRRRQPDADASGPVERGDPGSGGVWDTDAPPAGLTPRPSVRDQPAATELLIPAAAAAGEVDASGHEDASATPPHEAGSPRLRRRRLAQVAATIGALATTAVVIALASGATQPRLTHAATRPPTTASQHAATRHAATRTPPATRATKPNTIVRRAAATTAARKRTVSRHSRIKHDHRTHRARHATVKTHRHVSSTGTPATTPALAATQPAVTEPAVTEPQITSVRSDQAPAASVESARGGAASSCVPGELGC